MPTPAIVLNVLFFPLLIAANVMLLWAFRETKKAGIWPTERFFGFEIRRPFQLFSVIKVLQQRIQDAENAAEAMRFRRWLHAIYLGYGLGLAAIGVLLAFAPWLFSHVP